MTERRWTPRGDGAVLFQDERYYRGRIARFGDEYLFSPGVEVRLCEDELWSILEKFEELRGSTQPPTPAETLSDSRLEKIA